ncbi:MAG: hypothetical protein AAF702_34110 [Chloroflexota bacterium]
MKAIMGLGSLGFIGFMGWQLGSQLSSDAIGMALGVLFGIMAGIPAALMVLAAKRTGDYDRQERRRVRREETYDTYPHYPQQQPPVIVVTGQGTPPGQAGSYPQSYAQPSLASPHQMQIAGPQQELSHRQFRVVGGSDEGVDNW